MNLKVYHAFDSRLIASCVGEDVSVAAEHKIATQATRRLAAYAVPFFHRCASATPRVCNTPTASVVSLGSWFPESLVSTVTGFHRYWFPQVLVSTGTGFKVTHQKRHRRAETASVLPQLVNAWTEFVGRTCNTTKYSEHANLASLRTSRLLQIPMQQRAGCPPSTHSSHSSNTRGWQHHSPIPLSPTAPKPPTLWASEPRPPSLHQLQANPPHPWVHRYTVYAVVQ